MIQKIKNNLRKILPLSVRVKFGPMFAFLSYYFNLYLNFRYWRPQVLSMEETVDLILKNNLSFVRFGDGEMSLMENNDLAFQKFDQELSGKLKTILKSDLDGLLVCIPGIWGNISLFTKRSFWFIMHHLFRYGEVWKNLLSKNQIYGDAHITRPYLGFVDKTVAKNIFKKLFLIWQDKDVVLVEGEKSRVGVGNGMFDKVHSLKRILCPAENAYEKYSEILNELKKIDKNSIILLALGPTAKVLAYDLFLEGQRVLDIGHLDMEYEMFLNNSEKIVPIKYKYFNELAERNPESCDDPKYLSQIIVKII